MPDAHELVKQQFGAHAQAYATSTVHARGDSLGRLIELTNPQLTWRVLDVSTGAGHTALAFAPHVREVTASDLTPEMLEAAARLAAQRNVRNVQFSPADAEALPFGENEFDVVTNRIALHHYPHPEIAVCEMARVCKSGGVVALVDNVTPQDPGTAEFINAYETLRDPSHHRAHALPDLQAFFMRAGLRVEHTETLKKKMEFDSWVKRLGAPTDVQAQVRTMLLEAPAGAREFLHPITEDGVLYFRLEEAIVIGRKL